MQYLGAILKMTERSLFISKANHSWVHHAKCRNAWLDEEKPEIKIARRNNNNLGYAYDTNFMEESKEEL